MATVSLKAHLDRVVVQIDDEVILEMEVPFAERDSLDVYRQGNELYLQVGPYRRSFVLPDTLQRRSVVGAKLDDGVLAVRFGLP